MPARRRAISTAFDIALQADGKVLVVGEGCCDPASAFAIARFTQTGVPDPTWNVDGLAITGFSSNGPTAATGLKGPARRQAFAAGFHGSMGDKHLNKPITGMVACGDGYLMVAEDGGIFSFSNKPFAGSLGGNPPANPIVSVAVLG